MLGTEKARKENEVVHALHENFAEFRFEGNRYKRDQDSYKYVAMKYIANLKNHLTENIERFMKRAVFALYPGIPRKGKGAMINGITKDRKHKDEIGCVDKKASNGSTDEDSVIRAAIQEHRAVLGLANPTEKISELKNDKERYYRLILRYFVFLDRELERKAEMKLSEETNEEWERRKAVRMGKRFNVVPLSNIKSHFVTIDSRILHGIMKEISPEFDVRNIEFTGQNRETYWKIIFDLKRLKVNKQKAFTGMIETDGVAMCVHDRRFNPDRPVPSSTMQKDEKEVDPSTQKVHENDFAVGADPGNTNIVTVAVPKHAEDGTDGNLLQKDMRLLRVSRAGYYRESAIMNARKEIKTWTAEMKDRLEALTEVTCRGAGFQAFREFMLVRVADWDAL